MATENATGTVTDIAGLRESVGKHLGYTDWQEMTQDRVNRFADATDDHQFIHVDPERAKATPFGGTIAHGYLTLSLVAPIMEQLLKRHRRQDRRQLRPRQGPLPRPAAGRRSVPRGRRARWR